jgi:hypothetical protein
MLEGAGAATVAADCTSQCRWYCCCCGLSAAATSLMLHRRAGDQHSLTCKVCTSAATAIHTGLHHCHHPTCAQSAPCSALPNPACTCSMSSCSLGSTACCCCFLAAPVLPCCSIPSTGQYTLLREWYKLQAEEGTICQFTRDTRPDPY